MPAFAGAMQEPQHRNGEVQSLRLSREKWDLASVVGLANGENSAANAREKLDVEDTAADLEQHLEISREDPKTK